MNNPERKRLCSGLLITIKKKLRSKGLSDKA